jgi:ActR/RegA family two-component response regulator
VNGAAISEVHGGPVSGAGGGQYPDRVLECEVIGFQRLAYECWSLFAGDCPDPDTHADPRTGPARGAGALERPGVAARSMSHTQEQSAVGISLLVVEDDADVRHAVRIALSASTERVIDIASPAGLTAAVDLPGFDVVLLDMNFLAAERSGAAGLDTLAQIREIDPTLAVVLMTAYGGVALAVESLKRGAVDFILKPWRNDKLVAAISAAAKVTRTRREKQIVQLDILERAAIQTALAHHRGNISLAAAALGLSRAALYRRMSKHGL